MLGFNNSGMRWQIQSAFHEQARSRLNLHAMVHKALKYRA